LVSFYTEALVKGMTSRAKEGDKSTDRCYETPHLSFWAGVRMPRRGLRVSDTQMEELIQGYRMATARKDVELAKRIQGVLLVSSGMAESKAALIVQVARRTLQEWISKYRRGGLTALKKGPYPGRSPKLTEAQFEELGQIIEQGPESVGLDSDVWTAPLAVDLVNRLFGVKYHPDHMRKILKRLGFSVQ